LLVETGSSAVAGRAVSQRKPASYDTVVQRVRLYIADQLGARGSSRFEYTPYLLYVRAAVEHEFTWFEYMVAIAVEHRNHLGAIRAAAVEKRPLHEFAGHHGALRRALAPSPRRNEVDRVQARLCRTGTALHESGIESVNIRTRVVQVASKPAVRSVWLPWGNR
jgi:hypothetical protein